MRSLVSFALGFVVVLTLGVGSTFAATPEQIRETGTFELPPEYCETGVTLDVEFSSVRTVFWEGDEPVKVTYRTQYVVTTAGNDNVMIRHEAGQTSFNFVPEADGGFAIVSVGRGLPELIKTAHGAALLRDAGLLTITDHFDADDNYLGSDITIRGPHPDFESDFALQCEAVIAALGL